MKVPVAIHKSYFSLTKYVLLDDYAMKFSVCVLKEYFF